MKEVISVAAPARYAPFGTMNLPQPGRHFDSQGLGTRFPRAGNMIPKGWEHDSLSCTDIGRHI